MPVAIFCYFFTNDLSTKFQSSCMPAKEPVFRFLLVFRCVFGGLKPEKWLLSTDSCMCVNGIDKKPGNVNGFSHVH